VSITTLTPLPGELGRWPTVAPLDGTPPPFVPQGKIGAASIHPDHPASPVGPEGLPLQKPPYSRITAYNLNTGDIAWQVPAGMGMYKVRNNPALKGLNLPALGGQNGQGGVLVTKSLLIYGLVGSGAPGEAPGHLVAYDKLTGATLADVPLPGAPLGSPMTYQVGGKQYISLTLQGARLVALALNAGPASASPTVNPSRSGSAASDGALPAGVGRVVLQRACSTCHGVDVVTATRLDRAGWEDKVHDMVGRGASASPDEVEQVIGYLAANFAATKD